MLSVNTCEPIGHAIKAGNHYICRYWCQWNIMIASSTFVIMLILLPTTSVIMAIFTSSVNTSIPYNQRGYSPWTYHNCKARSYIVNSCSFSRTMTSNTSSLHTWQVLPCLSYHVRLGNVIYHYCSYYRDFTCYRSLYINTISSLDVWSYNQRDYSPWTHHNCKARSYIANLCSFSRTMTSNTSSLHTWQVLPCLSYHVRLGNVIYHHCSYYRDFTCYKSLYISTISSLDVWWSSVSDKQKYRSCRGEWEYLSTGGKLLI